MVRLLTILTPFGLAAGAACGVTDSADERTVGVYVAVIQAVAEEGPGEFGPGEGAERVIWAGPLEAGMEITLEDQVAVVEQLKEEDFATVRFVDEGGEAIDDDEDGQPARQDGLLVLLGEIPDGPAPTVRAQRYLHVEEIGDFSAAVEQRAGAWRVTGLEAAPAE
jgi:hypothetical protein